MKQPFRPQTAAILRGIFSQDKAHSSFIPRPSLHMQGEAYSKLACLTLLSLGKPCCHSQLTVACSTESKPGNEAKQEWDFIAKFLQFQPEVQQKFFSCQLKNFCWTSGWNFAMNFTSQLRESLNKSGNSHILTTTTPPPPPPPPETHTHTHTQTSSGKRDSISRTSAVSCDQAWWSGEQALLVKWDQNLQRRNGQRHTLQSTLHRNV